MLITLCKTTNDTEFKKCYNQIIRAYYPPEYEYREKNDDVDFSKSNIEKIIKKHETLYTVYKNGQYKFPFVKNFHVLFDQHSLTIDETILKDLNTLKVKRLFMPEKDDENNNEKDIVFYSENYKNFNHFINVVLATARIIQYFTGTDGAKRIEKILFENPKYKDVSDLSKKQYRRKLSKELSYSKSGENIRIFKLMLAAFYHDLGKTVVDHRHGMEGAIILSDHNSDSWNELNIICQKSIDKEFERDDLSFISDMVRYHDFFGTLSTGESGHIKFAELINVIKQFGYRDVRKGNDEVWNRRRYFDMWILNVADILVSLDNKWGFAEWLLEKEVSEKKLNEFFTFSNIGKKENHISCKIERLAHDFLDGLDILNKVNGIMHADNNQVLIEESRLKASNHVIERLARLISETIDQTIKNGDIKFLEFDNNDNIPFSKKYYIEGQIRSAVINSITSISKYQSFIEGFSIVGNLDYALGFFQKICKHSIEKIIEEMEYEKLSYEEKQEKIESKTGWIRNTSDAEIKDYKGDNVTNQFNAHFYLVNFTSVVVRILAHLIYRNTLSQDVVNFEFKDASNRLNTDKLNKLITLEGPFRSAQSIHFILESIFIY